MSSLSLLSICFDRVTIYIDVLLLLYCSPSLLLPLLFDLVYIEYFFVFVALAGSAFGKIQFCVNCCRSDAVTNDYHRASADTLRTRLSFTHTRWPHRLYTTSSSTTLPHYWRTIYSTHIHPPHAHHSKNFHSSKFFFGVFQMQFFAINSKFLTEFIYEFVVSLFYYTYTLVWITNFNFFFV